MSSTCAGVRCVDRSTCRTPIALLFVTSTWYGENPSKNPDFDSGFARDFLANGHHHCTSPEILNHGPGGRIRVLRVRASAGERSWCKKRINIRGVAQSVIEEVFYRTTLLFQSDIELNSVVTTTVTKHCPRRLQSSSQSCCSCNACLVWTVLNQSTSFATHLGTRKN